MLLECVPLELYDFSFAIVILAENHNPTILNPDFLIRTNILNSDLSVDEKKPLFFIFKARPLSGR